MTERINMIALLGVIFTVSCATKQKIAPPQGFAEIDNPCCPSKLALEKDISNDLKQSLRKFVNSDFVIIRSWYRSILKGQEDLTFWRDQLKGRLQKQEYAVVSENQIKTEKGSQIINIRFRAPRSESTYGYEVFLSIQDERLLIVEAGGRDVDLQKVEPQVNAFARKFSLEIL